ncbi:diguanylate cyclase domain-containing protein [Pinirhizobacter soli]|uniref:diguanylate cyclase domain-containing protein n=1 Tax=Pinirhizobacter soli TaxID=2786953 RepID=UPI00202A3D08|nr:diguanylate cyclase [Pinirhizobacter soli]
MSKRKALKLQLPSNPSALNGERGAGLGSELLAANEELLISMLRIQADADAARKALESLAESVGLDTLTQLPNRSLFLDRFAQAIISAQVQERRMALLFVDLDNFKQVNDQLGHSAGDQMLRRAASRLCSAVRGTDTVSRHGGDEFLILLSDVEDAADAERMAKGVIQALGLEALYDQAHLYDQEQLTASIGISIYPDHGDDPLALIENADLAMYAAKRQGSGVYRLFSTGLQAGRNQRATDKNRRSTPGVDVAASLPTTRKNLDIVAVIEEAVGTCRPVFDGREQSLRWCPSEVPVAMHGDAASLGRLFVSLLDSASKRAPEGGCIELSLTSTGRTAVVTLSDEGKKKATDAFMTCLDDGHGAELAEALDLVVAHGGAIITTEPTVDVSGDIVVILPL